MLAIELLDELVYGSREAAWPLIRHDLGLDYAEIGLLLAIPGLIGSALDPVLGVLGDGGRRRALVLAGGIAFALSAALAGLSFGFATLLVALVVGNPASGAFVSLAQATLMDVRPAERERSMAWWTLAGSLGYVVGPLLLTAAIWLGLGWRGLSLLLAAAALPLAVATRRLPLHRDNGESLLGGLRHALGALRRRDVRRWLLVLEAGDLMVDVLLGFLALYLVDVAAFDPAGAALGVAVWTGAGLVGDALLIPLLRVARGLRYLRASAAVTLVAYPIFLLVPTPGAKLVLLALLGLLNSGWYAIPQAELYAALPDRSGVAVAVGGIGGVVGSCVPLTLGIVAGAFGLATTMWILLLAPVALLALLPRKERATL